MGTWAFVCSNTVSVCVCVCVCVCVWQYFAHVEEAVWAVEVLVTSGKPVASTLCISPKGDIDRVCPAECAVRLVKAGKRYPPPSPP